MIPSASRIPAVTADRMREVDRLMVEKYGIQMVQMMENAGLNLARLVRRQRGGSVEGGAVMVAAGKGNNGGGGLVAARHLSNWGARVTVCVEAAEGFSGVPGLQYRALAGLPVEVRAGEEALRVAPADVAIDALIGYGLNGNPRGWAARMIEAAGAAGRAVVALDVPSGLDATTGAAFKPCVRAGATLTLALPKTGIVRPEARPWVGDLYLADIGVPPGLYRELGLSVPALFARDSLVRLTPGTRGWRVQA